MLDFLNNMLLKKYIKSSSHNHVCDFISFLSKQKQTFFQIRPEWRIEDLFVLTDVQNALFTDSLFTTRQMTQYKESPGDILALYDNIAYSKGMYTVCFRLFYIF